jgi:hypothetical protein
MMPKSSPLFRTVLALRPSVWFVSALAGVAVVGAASAQEQGGVRVIEEPQVQAVIQDVFVRPGNAAARPIRAGAAAVDDGFDLRAIRTAKVPADVPPLVSLLDSAEWAVREKAARSLEAHPAPDEALLRILDQDELAEEQRQRLMNVIARRILLRERGALGIRMNTRVGFAEGGIAGVEITQLIAGLPAERVLKVGDVITRIDERDIRVNTDLITHVQRMQPGEVIDVRVLRPRTLPAGQAPGVDWIRLEGDRWFEPIEVEFALGSFEKLGDTAGVVNPETQRRLEEVRRLRIQWDRAPVSLDGRVTVDGVVPPENSRPSGVKPTIRRLGQ